MEHLETCKGFYGWTREGGKVVRIEVEREQGLVSFIYPLMIIIEGSLSWTLDQDRNQALVLVNSMCFDMLKCLGFEDSEKAVKAFLVRMMLMRVISLLLTASVRQVQGISSLTHNALNSNCKGDRCYSHFKVKKP